MPGTDGFPRPRLHMAAESSIRRYRQWYSQLLRLYPEPYQERFAEGMEQTFADLLRERTGSDAGHFSFALWMFAETSAGMVRENMNSFVLRNKNIFYMAIATACILMIPLVAMQFSDEVKWTLFDFIFAGTILFGSGLTYELIVRKRLNSSYRIAVAIGVATGLILIWINGAVGIIGSENNPANLMYLGVLAIGAGGAIIARLRPHGMARALYTTAAAQFIVPIVALFTSRQAMLFEPPGVIRVFILNGFFVALFAFSGLLFQWASEAERQ